MTAPEFDDTDDLTPEEQQYGENPNLKQLRAKAKKADALEKSNNELTRKMAFMEAGLPDTPPAKLLRDHYQGDLTAEAIRKSAAEYGLIEVSQVPADELDAQDRVANLGQGGTPAQPPADMNQAIRRASGR